MVLKQCFHIVQYNLYTCEVKCCGEALLYVAFVSFICAVSQLLKFCFVIRYRTVLFSCSIKYLNKQKRCCNRQVTSECVGQKSRTKVWVTGDGKRFALEGVCISTGVEDCRVPCGSGFLLKFVFSCHFHYHLKVYRYSILIKYIYTVKA